MKEKFDQLFKLQKEAELLTSELDKHVLKICNWHRGLLRNLGKYDENVELYEPDKIFKDVDWYISGDEVNCSYEWYAGGNEYDSAMHYFPEEFLYSEEARNAFEKEVLDKIADFRDRETKRKIEEEAEIQQREIETMNRLMSKYLREGVR